MKKIGALLCWSSLIAAVLALTGSQAFASGFALVEQSGKGLGEAFAGGRTDTKDPSSLFYNPSAMAFMERNSVGMALSAIDITANFKDDGSRTATGMPLTGGNGGDGGETGVIPNLYYVQEVMERVKVGLTVNAPFGLATKYPDDWKGRYHGVKSDLSIVGISPTVAVEVLPDLLSLGGSVNVEYADAKLTNAIDFGTILMAAGTTPQALDGFADLTGDDWAVGYSLGLLCTITPDTRIGISYRSKVDHKLSGKVKFGVPATARGILDAMGLSNYFIDTHASARLTLPETLGLGAYQQLGEAFAVMADVTWTGWSRFKELVVNFNSGQEPSVTEEHWTDIMCYRLGLNYFPDPKWTIRVGTAYDEGAVKTAYRTPRIPDNDRIWLSVGAGYQFTDDLRMDIGYAHLFINDGKSDLVNKPEAGYLLGKYETSINIFSIEGSLLF
ncbi:MAG: outer membrane protein transport protein [Candidatus Euphemobacter frigidus]|nr:outer membrane protein transport protein [Candidatus Euphemobacter frigidus]MDP8276501.1 outer membrane protein transport protein [Candidatus Euphemobacter frigidus]